MFGLSERTEKRGRTMAFENVGAYIGNSRPKTKKALREAIANLGETEVYFDTTSPFSTTSGYSLSQIPVGVKLSVVGPDPHTKRSWYATVSRDANGLVTIT